MNILYYKYDIILHCTRFFIFLSNEGNTVEMVNNIHINIDFSRSDNGYKNRRLDLFITQRILTDDFHRSWYR